LVMCRALGTSFASCWCAKMPNRIIMSFTR
jgi:hypothetical protein